VLIAPFTDPTMAIFGRMRLSVPLYCLLLLTVAVEAVEASAAVAVSEESLAQRALQFAPQRRVESNSHKNGRILQEEEEGQAQEEGFSLYKIRQGHCFRMKIVNDNDDDGNSYFYNGAYRAQYKRYLSYLACPATNEANNYSNCHEYVSGLEDYLEQTVPFVQTYCGTCLANCGNRLRSLEEENQVSVTVDCSTCVNECKLLNSNKGNSGTDESNYIDCQAANNDGGENGEEMQYYTAPQCENDHVVIGHFYDNECTIKTSTLSDSVFSYNTFGTIAGLPIDCSSATENDGDLLTETCRNLYEASVSCEAAQEQEDVALCKAAAAAGRVNTYYKQPFFKPVPITLIAILLFAMGVGCGFLSYTYYVRHHRTNKALIPMAELDHNPLPPIS
jgi:hypothetical protein